MWPRCLPSVGCYDGRRLDGCGGLLPATWCAWAMCLYCCRCMPVPSSAAGGRDLSCRFTPWVGVLHGWRRCGRLAWLRAMSQSACWICCWANPLGAKRLVHGCCVGRRNGSFGVLIWAVLHCQTARVVVPNGPFCPCTLRRQLSCGAPCVIGRWRTVGRALLFASSSGVSPCPVRHALCSGATMFVLRRLPMLRFVCPVAYNVGMFIPDVVGRLRLAWCVLLRGILGKGVWPPWRCVPANVNLYVINIIPIICMNAKNAVSLQYATRTKL